MSYLEIIKVVCILKCIPFKDSNTPPKPWKEDVRRINYHHRPKVVSGGGTLRIPGEKNKVSLSFVSVIIKF